MQKEVKRTSCPVGSCNKNEGIVLIPDLHVLSDRWFVDGMPWMGGV